MASLQLMKEECGLGNLIGRSPGFVKEVKKIPVVAGTDVSVLITGETGTGKELFARAIHYLSRRSQHPFVPINCGAIPIDLMESELFGHEQGSFTGATSRRTGLIQEARGGSVFLDEIDTLMPHAQVKLLRFLQEKECRAVGSARSETVDVRVISATNINVDEALKTGRVRTDLYYRLSIVSLRIPPLRERQDDIQILAEHFVKKYSQEFCKPVESISQSAVQALKLHDWPGNVRELENVVARAVVLAEGPVIQHENVIVGKSDAMQVGPLSMREMKSRVVEQFEKTYLRDLLIEHRGNVSRAALAAKKNRRALTHLISKHNIDLTSIRHETSGQRVEYPVDVFQEV